MKDRKLVTMIVLAIFCVKAQAVEFHTTDPRVRNVEVLAGGYSNWGTFAQSDSAEFDIESGFATVIVGYIDYSVEGCVVYQLDLGKGDSFDLRLVGDELVMRGSSRTWTPRENVLMTAKRPENNDKGDRFELGQVVWYNGHVIHRIEGEITYSKYFWGEVLPKLKPGIITGFTSTGKPWVQRFTIIDGHFNRCGSLIPCEVYPTVGVALFCG